MLNLAALLGIICDMSKANVAVIQGELQIFDARTKIKKSSVSQMRKVE